MASFNSAFAAARKSGKKEFTWNGKRYNTKLKEEAPKKGFASTPKKGPVPSARAPIPTPKPSRGKFAGVTSDDLPTPKKAVKKTSAKSGATQGFGLGEAKNSAAFKAGNERARKYQKGELLYGKGEGTFMERFKKGLK